MRRSAEFAARALTALFAVSSPAYSCSYEKPPSFGVVAPTAKYIFVFRVMSLEVDERVVKLGDDEVISTGVRGRIKVEINIRGNAARFKTIAFHNDWCGGVAIQIGHRYLIATSQSEPMLQLAAADETIGDIDIQYSPVYYPIEENPYVVAAKAAVAGKLPYEEVLDAAALQRTSVLPPLMIEVADPEEAAGEGE